MAYIKGSLDGFPILADDSASDVPITDPGPDGADIMSNCAAWIARKRKFLEGYADNHNDGTIVAYPSGTKWAPASDDDDDRGTALAAALTAFAASSDTELHLSPFHTYRVSSALTINLSRRATICGGLILAATGTDMAYVLKVNNQGTGLDVVTIRSVIVDHNNCLRVSAVGDTLYVSGVGPVDLVGSIIRNGAHDSNTNDASPSADGSLLRIDGTGTKQVIDTQLIDAGYSTFRNHCKTLIFRNVWSICKTKKDGAYQRHGYCDSEAADVNLLLHSWIGGGVVDRVAHKVNMNLDPSSNGPTWLEELYMRGLFFDISTSHTNPDTDSFLKVNYVRNASMIECVQRHSQLATIEDDEYVEHINETSLETFLNIGICDKFVVNRCDFDGAIKGIGSASIQCNYLEVKNTIIGRNAWNITALPNVANFGYVHWEGNEVYNLRGPGDDVRCIFDCTNMGASHKLRLVGRNKFHCKFPFKSGTAAAIFRAAPTVVGVIACDDLDIVLEPDGGGNTYLQSIVHAFTDVERVCVTAYPGDPLRLNLTRNLNINSTAVPSIAGGGTYVHNQDAPAGSADYWPAITGKAGAQIWNFRPGNGAAQQYLWNASTLWDLPA